MLKWLEQQIRREERRQKKETLRELRADLRRTGAARKIAMKKGVTECRRARLAAKRRCKVGVDRYQKARIAWHAALGLLRSEMRRKPARRSPTDRVNILVQGCRSHGLKFCRVCARGVLSPRDLYELDSRARVMRANLDRVVELQSALEDADHFLEEHEP
jgi:hypothetical protein